MIDNTFTNNLSKPHTSGILTHQVSDHFIHFSIVEDSEVHSINQTKYIETETINPKSIANFKNSINIANLITQFDLNPLGDPNDNYNILAHALSDAKHKHIDPMPIDLMLEERCLKFIWSCINSNNTIVKSVSSSAIMYNYSSLGENYRFQSDKYDIWPINWTKSFSIVLRNFYDYVDKHVFSAN